MKGKRSSRLGSQLLCLSLVASLLYIRLHSYLVLDVASETNGRDLSHEFSRDTTESSFLPPPLRMMHHSANNRTSLQPTVTDLFSQSRTINNKNRSVSYPLFTAGQIQDIPSPPWSFFYNIYMPIDPVNASLVRDILDEQLHQVAVSYAANYRNTSLTIFYNTIGGPVDPAFVDQACRRWNARMRCVHMHHYDEAFEEKTLARVQDYCQLNPTHRVGYMHNKGSYNSRNSKNQYWRRHMTMAITDPQCIEPPDPKCDMCGLNFYVLPWLHFSGNFFMARCTYINRLLPMEEFRDKMSELAVQTTEYEQQGRFLFHIFRNKDTYMGLDRYASEAWAGSHPSLVACDLSTERKVDFWKKFQHDARASWNFSLFPRPDDQRGRFLHVRRTLRNKATYRMREYYLLAGNVFKWIHLYGQVPPKTSWVWKHFPDGDDWWEGHRLFGDKVVEALLDGFALQDGNLSLPIHANVTKHDQDFRHYAERKERQKQRRTKRREREKLGKKQNGAAAQISRNH